jgi:hypothetical protein
MSNSIWKKLGLNRIIVQINGVMEQGKNNRV